jgi:hypothetical protein
MAEELPMFYRGVRPLGMGGAFTAVADDENAIFYNPAGLNSIQGFQQVEILNPIAEMSEKTLKFYKDLNEALDAPQSEKDQKTADVLNRYIGEHLHMRTSVFPNVVLHNFGIGVLGQAVFDGEVHNPLGSTFLQVRGGYDLALLVSGAYGVFGQYLQIGATGKIIRRSLLDKAYTANEIVSQNGISLSDDIQNGVGIGGDIGAILRLPVLFTPAIGITVQNVRGINLDKAGKISEQINAGIALKPPFPIGQLVLAADVMDLGKESGSDDDLYKRVHMGAEYTPFRMLSLRAGLNQGYPTFGATLDLWLLKIVGAYYVEEIGAFAGQRDDQRYVLQASLGF